jgi:phosphosulfolactate phosphohydrolase-like enzyme
VTSIDVHADWGLPGLRALAHCPVLVVVDVLSFSTAVDVATTNGAQVLPLRWHGASVPAGVALVGRRSPEAELAAAAFHAVSDRIGALLADCESGRELAELGFAHDVALAAEVNSSRTAPVLRNGSLEASRGE